MSARLFVAHSAELKRAGFARSRIESWVRQERLIRLLHGVYSYGRDVETREAAWRAALLASGADSCLTGRSALEFFGAVRSRERIPAAIFVASQTNRTGTFTGVSPALAATNVTLLRRRPETGDVLSREGLRIMKPTLALMDFAVDAPEREVRFAFLELCRLRLFGKGDLDLAHRRSTGRRGARKLKPLLALWVPELHRIRSVLEGAFLIEWVKSGCPIPAVNARIFGYEVDFLWFDQRLVLELDGDSFHQDPLARSRDRTKTEHLRSNGLQVMRFTWKQFMADPEAAVRSVAERLRERDPPNR